MQSKQPWESAINSTFDCELNVATELDMSGDKQESRDALSLLIVELSFSHVTVARSSPVMSLSTFGHEGESKERNITKKVR